LRAAEPLNAETLTGALAREKSLHASYDPDLLQPIEAAKDVLGDGYLIMDGDRHIMVSVMIRNRIELMGALASMSTGAIFVRDPKP